METPKHMGTGRGAEEGSKEGAVRLQVLLVYTSRLRHIGLGPPFAHGRRDTFPAIFIDVHTQAIPERFCEMAPSG